MTVVAVDLPVLFAGALFAETMYSWRRMGRLFVDAATRFDCSVDMGIVAAIAFLVVVSNLLADVVYAILDPADHLLVAGTSWPEALFTNDTRTSCGT